MTTNGRDQAIEAWLQEHGITEFEYKDRLSISSVDRKASFSNQARLYGAIDEDHAVLLAVAMDENPQAIPPIIGVKHKTGIKILGGNHRFKAAADVLDWRTIPAYLITQELTETQEVVLAYLDNLRHGKPTSLEERLHHATWLVEHRSMSHKDAAKTMGIPEKKLNFKLSRDTTVRRLDSLGLKRERARIHSANAVVRLGSIRDDDVLNAATKLVAEAKLGTEDVSRLVAKINKLSTVAAQLALIEQAAASVMPDIRETAAGKVGIPRILTNLKTIIGKIERVDLNELSSTSADPDTKKRLRAQTMQASARLAEIAQVL